MKRLDNGMLIELSKKTGRGSKREEREKEKEEKKEEEDHPLHPWLPIYLFAYARMNFRRATHTWHAGFLKREGSRVGHE